MAESMGLGKMAQQWATKFYRNGAHLGGVITTDSILKPEQLDDARREINRGHSGLDNAAKWMVLMGGAKATPLGAPPETAKLVEVLGISERQIAQILRIPPHVLYDLQRATWNNVEHMGRELVQFSLTPWLVLAEQELRRKLFTRAERGQGLYIKFSVDALLRGDAKTRAELARLYLSEGVINVNEQRRLMELPPIDADWANAYRVPANAMPANRLTQPVDTGDASVEQQQ
jgi:HK97 family phage portal protein